MSKQEIANIDIFSQILNCDTCPVSEVLRDEYFNLPQPGYIGKNYQRYRVLFIGQNPGVSKHPEEDLEYAKLLKAMKHNRNANSFDKLNQFLRNFIPTWLMVKRYSPLAACGLELDDIAYTNVVHCRTSKNAPPSKQVVMTCKSHLDHILDILQPVAVVCLGKFAYDNIQSELDQRNIDSTYINRIRSQSLAELERNINKVGIFIKQKISSSVP